MLEFVFDVLIVDWVLARASDLQNSSLARYTCGSVSLTNRNGMNGC